MTQAITEPGQSENPEDYESCINFWQERLPMFLGEEAAGQIIGLIDSTGEEDVRRALFTSAMLGYNVMRDPGNQDLLNKATGFFERHKRDPHLAQIEDTFIVAASATNKVLRGQNPST